MRRFILGAFFLAACCLTIQPAHAAACNPSPIFAEDNLPDQQLPPSATCAEASLTHPPAPEGKIIGAGLIHLYANDEAKYSSLNNVLHAISQLEGKYIYPGEIFSFNRAANLLQEQIPYDLGPDVNNNLVKAGGVCMVSTMIATAAHDAGLPFISERGRPIKAPIPHSRFYRYYHQENIVNSHLVPIVEAAVSIKRDNLDEPWKTVQDMQFINTSGRILVLHFEPSFTWQDLDLTHPFGLIQQDHSLRVELRAVPTGFDAWFDRLNTLSMN